MIYTATYEKSQKGLNYFDMPEILQKKFEAPCMNDALLLANSFKDDYNNYHKNLMLELVELKNDC